MPKLLFARALDDQERTALERYLSSDNEILKQRALIILLSAEEQYRIPEIAPIVGLHVDKVRKWVVRFNDSGLRGLQPPRRKPGPHGKFGQDVRSQILRVAATPPRQLGQLRSTWTLDSLRAYLVQNGIVDEISRESLRQILLQGRVDWHSYRPRYPDISRWMRSPAQERAN